MLQIVGSVNDDDKPVPTESAEPEITFDDWYLLYPRHVAKKDAKRAWANIPKNKRVEVMIATVAWRKVWLDRGELEYTPFPATWLNGERWDDDLPRGYSLMPKTAPNVVPINGSEPPFVKSELPEHVKVMLAKLKEKHK